MRYEMSEVRHGWECENKVAEVPHSSTRLPWNRALGQRRNAFPPELLREVLCLRDPTVRRAFLRDAQPRASVM